MPFISDPQGREEVEKVSRRLKLPVWKSFCKGNFRKWWNEWWDKIDTFAEEIEAIEIKAGTGLEGGGNLTKNRTLNLKKATGAELGGIIVGDNLTVDSNGRLSGEDISGKLDKGGYEGDAKNLYESIVELEKYKLPKGNLPVYLENAETIIKMLQGNAGLFFDNNILYIQQTGTKAQNKYYFDINTGRMYRCLNNTTTVINTPNLFIDESNRGIIEIIDSLFNQKLVLENVGTFPINIRNIENFSGYKFVIVQINDFLEPANNTIFTIPVFTITLGKPIFLPANGYRTTASNIANFINFTSYTTVEIGETGGGAGQDTITLYYM